MPCWEGALGLGADMPAPAFWEVMLRALRSCGEGCIVSVCFGEDVRREGGRERTKGGKREREGARGGERDAGRGAWKDWDWTWACREVDEPTIAYSTRVEHSAANMLHARRRPVSTPRAPSARESRVAEEDMGEEWDVCVCRAPKGCGEGKLKVNASSP